MKKNFKKIGGKAYHYGVQLVAVGALTGLFAGTVITLYNFLVEKSEAFSHGLYEFIELNPAFIPLLFLALFAGAIIVGGVMKFIPMIRGCGIPQTEGATRGMLHFKWYHVLTGMFATSLFTVFMGVSAGAEGPSIQIGGACGAGTGAMLRRGEAVRRYQITGGACTGLAVASNAPLTGIIFAYEEAHKRFTPEVFICAFSSVVFGVITRNLLRYAMGLPIGAVLSNYNLATPDLLFCAYVLVAAIVCGVVGGAFYHVTVRVKNLFDKVTFWKGLGKMLVPFMLAGALGLIISSAAGGGHHLLESLGGGMSEVGSIFSSPLWASLLILVLVKFISTVVNMGSGVPCDIFIPMLAIGACIGGLMSLLCQQMGMNAQYSDLLVLICMSAFFTTVVKAPITAIVLTVELTWNFTFLLPVIIGVSIGYLMGDVFRTQPIYEKFLDDMVEEEKSLPMRHYEITLRVLEDYPADGRDVRDILWPSYAVVTSVTRKGESFAARGKTTLYAGDVLNVHGKTLSYERCVSLLKATAGEIVLEKDVTPPKGSEQ